MNVIIGRKGTRDKDRVKCLCFENHEKYCNLFHYHEDGNSYYITIERIDGYTVSKVATAQQFPEGDPVKIELINKYMYDTYVKNVVDKHLCV